MLGLRLQALAKASLDEVNAMWAGLGYYRRARYLLEGAQYVMEHHDGVFPKTSKELQKFPGASVLLPSAIRNSFSNKPAVIESTLDCVLFCLLD